MTMKRKIAATTLGVALFAAVGGCTSYYKVTDPTTGREYYTTELQRKGSGAATLKDGRTGNTVNLQNSEIAQISKEAYDQGRFAQATPQPEEAASKKDASNPFK